MSGTRSDLHSSGSELETKDSRSPSPELPAALQTALQDLLGKGFQTSAEARADRGRDESPYPPVSPLAVCVPSTVEEVSETVRLCTTASVPVIPFGCGTSLEGGVLATSGGVSLDLRALDRILAIREDDLDTTVQAGVTRLQLDRALSEQGNLFFPVDPGTDASLGGMAATGASGTNAVRYGTMRDRVLSLQVVLADGRVIRTGRRARKSVAGYDLTRLMVGSEGTLGIITELTLRLSGRPEASIAAVCPFPTIDDAVRTVTRTMAAGLPVAKVELLDRCAVEAIRDHSGLDLEPAPTLFFELHGTEAAVLELAQRLERLAAEQGGRGFRWASEEAERQRLWQARYNAYYAALALRPGCRARSTDVCVPISALPRCIAETAADVASLPFPAPLVGHVGDGNFHLILILDPDSEAETTAARELNERLMGRALALDGTITGEHGVGLGKRSAMAAEHGPALEVMRAIKQALDPHNLLNPGKVLPPT